MAWVLIVDDDPDIRETLQYVLRDAGYAIVEVADGEDALDVLRATPYHAVVLLDLLMPGMDGREVLDILQTDHALAKRHAFVLMSANHQALQRVPPQLLSELKITLLPKPFDVSELLGMVADLSSRLPGSNAIA
jgi:CheY-like chemotaxis protein